MRMFSWFRLALARRRWRREQDELRQRLLEHDDCLEWSPSSDAKAKGRRPISLIGGLDISFFSDGGNPNDNRACAALIVCKFDDAQEQMTVVWEDFRFIRMTEPYIAGFLAFREAPHYCAMLQRLAAERPDLLPDVVLVDGNGVLHPRGFGVASHVGVLSGHCTVGVAKNLHMVDGLDRTEVRDRCASSGPNDFVPLVGASGRTWGAAVLPRPRRQLGPKRATQAPKNPIFVSVGHRVGLETCVQVINLCLLSARVPEPVRLADVLSREQVRNVREKEGKEKHGNEQAWQRARFVAVLVATPVLLGAAGLLLRRAGRRHAL